MIVRAHHLAQANVAYAVAPHDDPRLADFVARARRAGIQVPILPGIMPFTSVEQVERFTATCGATIPARLHAAMEALRNDPDGARELGVAFASLALMTSSSSQPLGRCR